MGKKIVVPRILEEIFISALNHYSLKFIVYVSLHSEYANLYYLYFHYFFSFWGVRMVNCTYFLPCQGWMKVDVK
jgi:hypothetical protein